MFAHRFRCLACCPGNQAVVLVGDLNIARRARDRIWDRRCINIRQLTAPTLADPGARTGDGAVEEKDPGRGSKPLDQLKAYMAKKWLEIRDVLDNATAKPQQVSDAALVLFIYLGTPY